MIREGRSTDWLELVNRPLSRHGFLKTGAAAGGSLAALLLGATPGSVFAAPDALAHLARASSPRYGGILKCVFETDPVGLDPALSSALSSYRILEHIYTGLMRYDDNLLPVPDLAESYEMPNNRTYIFHLRKGVLFHDGSPMTSADVKFTYDRIRSPKTGSPHAWYFSEVDHIDTPDKYTVIFHMKKPFAPLLNALAQGLNGVQSRAAVEKYGKLEKHLIGTGPFMFKQYIPQTVFKMTRNPHYYEKGLPYLDGLEIAFQPDEAARTTALRSNSADFVLFVPARDFNSLKGTPNLVLTETLGTVWDYLGLNCKRKPFSDKRVRQAIAWALNRDDIVRVVYYGHAEPSVCGPLPAWSWAHCTTPVYPHSNLTKAKKLLAEAGYANGFSMTISASPSYPVQIAEAQVAQAALKPLGIKVKIRTLEWGQYIDAVVNKHDFEGADLGWGSFIDPDEYLYPEFHSNLFWDFYGYSNPKVDALLEQARTTIDRNARRPLYLEVQRIVAGDAPYIFYTNLHDLGGYFSYLKGFKIMRNQSNIYFRKSWLAR
jgi:peptide/nickel transport system substrate-binding protein